MARLIQHLALLVFLSLAAPGMASPTLQVTLTPERTAVGDPVVLTLEVRWPGPPSSVALYPPEVKLPDSIVRGSIRQSQISQDNQTVTTYTYQLRPTGTGDIALGKVSIEYRDTAGGSAGGSVLEEALPTLTVVEGGWKATLARLLPGLLAAAVLGSSWFLLRRRLRPTTAVSPMVKPPTVQELLEAARKQLSDGQADAVYETLKALKPLLPPGQDVLPSLEALEESRLQLRYGGIQGTPETLNMLLTSVEAALKQSSGSRNRGS
jgi:hypothetical protein